MSSIRTTIVLDEFIAARVRQLFGGNLSKGINVVLRQHLIEEPRKESLFGILHGKVSVRDLEKMRKEEREAEKRDQLLRR